MNTPKRQLERRDLDRRDVEPRDLDPGALDPRDLDPRDLDPGKSDSRDSDSRAGDGPESRDRGTHDPGRGTADADLPEVPPLRILVVEDEGLIALNLELMLHRFGCEIIGPVSRVDDIVSAARTHRPDGAFLDVNLRGRKVFDILPEMIGLGVPCVLSSGYDDPMLFPVAYRDLPRIAKPFDESELRRACVEFGMLAAARQSQAAGAAMAADGHGHGGEAVAFRRRRRFAPARPVGEQDEPRAVAAGAR